MISDTGFRFSRLAGMVLALWLTGVAAAPAAAYGQAPTQGHGSVTAAETGAPAIGAPAEALPDAPGEIAATASSSSLLPDAGVTEEAAFPGAAAQQNPPGTPGSPLPRHASPLDTVVAAGQVAPHQTAGNKIVSSLRDPITPFSIAGNVISAGYSHLTNGSPNYGTDGTAFAQRFGAAVARGASQSVFTNGVMASVLHQDTRYYQQGPKYSFGHRIIYAATRPLIGRTDSGKTIPNVALLTGYLGAAFLTRTYYPEKNQTVSENLQTYGSSIGGAAIGFGVSEFLPQVLQAVHLTKLSRNTP